MKPLPRIGTPLTKGAIKVMLLGSGELGKELTIELQRFGVEVVAVDRYANAPAHQVAHSAHVIDMTDAVALKSLIASEKPTVVVPEIEAIATQVLVELEKDGLWVVPSARAVYLTMNREGIRRLAAETLGLATSPYRFAGSLAELETAVGEVGYPAFVKPVMSSSGKGQSKITQASDIARAFEVASTAGRVATTRIICEGAIDFDYEITLLTVRSLDASGAIVTSYCEPIGHLQIAGDYVESWQPQAMPEGALAKARAIARAITGELDGLGLFGVELFVKGEDVWFSEVSPRPHDTGMVTMASQRQSEFELHARAILGLPVDTGLSSPAASAVIYGGVAAKGVAFEGLPTALAVPGTSIRLFGKPEAFAKRRMGVALAFAADVDLARARARAAAAQVRVVAA
jgi:phosphoribosylglycinamide formyltransferase 2